MLPRVVPIFVLLAELLEAWLSWYLTWVSANHASSNSTGLFGQPCAPMRGTLSHLFVSLDTTFYGP